jgi:hypothetical protein
LDGLNKGKPRFGVGKKRPKVTIQQDETPVIL